MLPAVWQQPGFGDDRDRHLRRRWCGRRCWACRGANRDQRFQEPAAAARAPKLVAVLLPSRPDLLMVGVNRSHHAGAQYGDHCIDDRAGELG
jgi:hypothetical protein